MLFLKTLGGLSVEADGAPATGAAQQRKTLALLAVVAAAGRRGISRDKLVAYLWPESDAEHARHRLKQACYILRRDLRAPDLFLGVTELRLNPAVLASDVEAFEAALERGDEAQAIELYTGLFLDGFYLSDAPEFERWVEVERDRLQQRACEALEKLATEAGARGDHLNSVEWWRRLTRLDPLNSRAVLGLMNALAAAGDRAGALRVASVHEGLLREELEATPDAAVVQLTERLRAHLEPSPSSPRPPVPVPATPAAIAPDGESLAGADVTASDHSRIGTARGSRRAWKRAAGGFTVVVSGLLISGWLLLRAPFGAPTAETSPEPKRLVVLPFTNLGPAEEEYFADGVTEEITARLAAIGDLRVIGSTSANAYKGAEKTIPEIGQELGVDYVLEGSIRWQRSAQGRARVRVTPQLVSTADGTHLWAEVYDEPLDEIFRVQSDIAQRVVQALDVTLVEPQRRALEAVPTRNLQAYDYFLLGNELMRQGSEERPTRTALRMYEKAVDLDPTFALAYTRLSRMHARMYWFHYDRAEDRLRSAKRAVDRAFELEPGLPEAHQALGAYYFMAHLDYERASREFATAQASRPNDVNIFLARAAMRVRQGHFPEARADFERALQLDPGSPLVANNYAQWHDLVRDHPRAEALHARAIALSPAWAFPYAQKAGIHLRRDGDMRKARAVLEEARAVGVTDNAIVIYTQVLVDLLDRRYEAALGRLSTEAPEIIRDQFRFIPRTLLQAELYELLGRPDLARAHYDSALSVIRREVGEWPADPRLRSALGIAYAGLSRTREAIEEGRRAVELMPISREAYRGYYRAWDLARIYTMVGEHDAAIDLLEHLLSVPGRLTSAWLRIDPTWDPLRAHPRFVKLLDPGH